MPSRSSEHADYIYTHTIIQLRYQEDPAKVTPLELMHWIEASLKELYDLQVIKFFICVSITIHATPET